MHALDSLAARVFSLVPSDLISLIARISIGTVFFRSGLTKIDGCKSLGELLSCRVSDSAYYLFANEYKVPVIAPNLAANLATVAELTLPLFLWAGLLSRFAALALLLMTLVIQVFVYPNAFDTHGVWAVALLFIMVHGPGRLSLDWIIGSRGAT
jgi:putative oxidoreductase